MTEETAELRETVSQLKRELRKFKVLMGAVATGVMVLAVSGHVVAPPERIDATEFRLLDGSGRMRASLSMDLMGPSLRLFAEDGEATVRLRQIRSVGPALQFSGKAMNLDLSADGLQIRDTLNLPRLGLSAPSEYVAFPQMSLHDEAGRKRIFMAVSEDGGGLMALLDASGTYRAAVGQNALLLTDPSGRIIWERKAQ